ncbi:MAG: hypothetical protein GY947_11660 [Rhodobacteraceae bacterium]|nr:hypothetical protein [Paracoccaceae bacterium]
MKGPWHIWVIGVVSFVFNAGGAFDYVMTQTQNPEYMAQFTQAQLDYFYGFETWVVAAWAIAVWCALLGSLLLLLRRRWAASAFAVSLVAMFVTFVQNFFLSEVKMQDVVGPQALIFSGIIALVAIALFLYARWMAKRGVLR